MGKRKGQIGGHAIASKTGCARSVESCQGPGVERTSIFRSDEDWEDFLTRLGALYEAEAVSVYAWGFLDNHFHLLIRTGKQGISEGMRKLLTGYVVGFNRRYGECIIS